LIFEITNLVTGRLQTQEAQLHCVLEEEFSSKRFVRKYMKTEANNSRGVKLTKSYA